MTGVIIRRERNRYTQREGSLVEGEAARVVQLQTKDYQQPLAENP